MRSAHTFDGKHGGTQTTHVQHLTHLGFGSRALAFVVHLGQHFFDHRCIGLSTVLQRQGVVAFGAIAHVFHIGLGTGPPHAVHLVARKARGHGLFEGGGVHHAPTPVEHIVGAVLADLQPGGFLLHAGVGHGQQGQHEAMHGSALLQQRNGLFAIRAVVINQGDFFALEFVKATFFGRQVLDQNVSRAPVGAGQREVPLEHLAVGRFTAAIARGDQGNLVARGFFGQRKRDASGQRLEHGGTAIFAFEALVALDATVGGIAGFALFKRHLHAVDATAGIDQLEVVGIAIGKGHAIGCISASAIHQQGEKLIFGLGQSRCGHAGDHSRHGHAGREGEFTQFQAHQCLL